MIEYIWNTFLFIIAVVVPATCGFGLICWGADQRKFYNSRLANLAIFAGIVLIAAAVSVVLGGLVWAFEQ